MMKNSIVAATSFVFFTTTAQAGALSKDLAEITKTQATQIVDIFAERMIGNSLDGLTPDAAHQDYDSEQPSNEYSDDDCSEEKSDENAKNAKQKARRSALAGPEPIYFAF